MTDSKKRSSSKQQHWLSIADVFKRGDVVMPSSSFSPSREFLEQLAGHPPRGLRLAECESCGELVAPGSVECYACLQARVRREAESKRRAAENNHNACIEVES